MAVPEHSAGGGLDALRKGAQRAGVGACETHGSSKEEINEPAVDNIESTVHKAEEQHARDAYGAYRRLSSRRLARWWLQMHGALVVCAAVCAAVSTLRNCNTIARNNMAADARSFLSPRHHTQHRCLSCCCRVLALPE